MRMVINVVIDSDMVGQEALMRLAPQALEDARVGIGSGVMTPRAVWRGQHQDPASGQGVEVFYSYRFVYPKGDIRPPELDLERGLGVFPPSEPVPSTGQVEGDES